MPGTIVFRALEANLTDNSKSFERRNSFCSFTMGDQKVKGDICEQGGNHPHWNDAVTIQVNDTQKPTCLVELKDQTKEASDSSIGSLKLNLEEIESNKQVKRWYPIYDHEKPIGELLLEATYQTEESAAFESEKAAQGNIPAGIDLYQLSREGRKWETEPANSLGKVAETNEFGDYTASKSLFSGDSRHERGSGMLAQGNYYSGQQTSYGEAYPMAQKSVAMNNIYSYDPEHHNPIDGRVNPYSYAMYQQQAFEPHRQTGISDTNKSVVEKAFESFKKSEGTSMRVPINNKKMPEHEAESTGRASTKADSTTNSAVPSMNDLHSSNWDV